MLVGNVSDDAGDVTGNAVVTGWWCIRWYFISIFIYLEGLKYESAF